MRILFFSAICLAIFSCKKESSEKESLYPDNSEISEGPMENMTASEKLGKELFDGKGNCFSCHKPEQKVIGPSIKEIARIYKEENADMVTFLKGKGEPIVDPSQYEVMKTNFYITKNFSDEELKALEDYMMSFIAE